MFILFLKLDFLNETRNASQSTAPVDSVASCECTKCQSTNRNEPAVNHGVVQHFVLPRTVLDAFLVGHVSE